MPEHIGTPRRRGAAAARRAAIGTTAASVALVGLPTLAWAAPPATPFVSEIHYDNAGEDTGEFIEVQLPPGTSSAGLSVVLYNGSNGAPYGSARALPDVTAPADAPAVAVLDYPTDGLQNGSPDAIALVADGTVLEFLSYEGVLTAVGGPAAGATSTDIGVSQSNSTPVGQSLSRSYDAATGALVWAGPAASTRGAVNAAPQQPDPDPAPSTGCDATPTHEIGAVQGSGAETPLADQQVTVRGVVVGDLPGFSGFYLQDADGDGDDATSDGVFVYSTAAVDLGDTVTVTGTAGEFEGQTQLGAGSTVSVCAEGTAADLPSPAPLDLPADDAERERLEGMLVAPADALTVSEVYDLTRYGELTLSEGGLLVQPTELARPGPAAEAVAAANAQRRIVLDDAVTAQVTPATAPYLSAETPVRVGDELSFSGPLVLGYGFDQWRLQPADGTAEGTFAPRNTRPETPDAVGGDVQVGAFNVLNYFLTLTGSDARGATSAAELEQQAAKIVTAINAMDADVLTLMEIEDTATTRYGDGSADQAVADLVGRLNAAAGAEKWAYVPFPEELLEVDRDVIRNAIIYQPAAVTPVGEPVGLVDEANFDNAREPVAQTFEAGGDAFTVVANHFKSKGSGTGENADQRDGQGASNPDRVGQAEALAGFVAELQESTGDDDVLVLGDLNAYSQEDPIVALRDAGLTDLGTEFDAGRYSYVFDDMSGSLDHAMATASLTGKVTDVAHWNINSVESFAYQYTGADRLYAPDPYRSSDHDPVLVGLDLGGTTEPEPQPEPGVGNPTGVANGNSWLHPQDRVGYIAGHFRNTDSVPVDVRLITPYGSAPAEGSPATRVAPGAAVYLTVNSQLAELPAGTATFRVYKNVDGKGYQSLFPVSYPGQSAAEAVTELQLLGINDFHGRLAEGAVALAGTVEEQRARADVDATLLLSAGDNIGASPFVSSVQQDRPTLEVLNELGLQASAVGNHEFDRGFEDLVGRVDDLADFPNLGANVYRGEEPALPEYALLDADGVSVGVIGVVTEETRSLVSPDGIEGITFGDPVAAANRVVAELTDGTGDEADVIVLLAHEGAPAADSIEAQLAADTAFARIVEGVDADVDAIFTGHTHLNYAWEAPVPGEEGTRPVIQTGSYAAALGQVVLTYDEIADEVTGFSVANLPLTTTPVADLVAAYPVVAEVSATVAAAKAYADEVGSEVIGSITADITRAKTATGAEDRGAYSALGGLVADTYVRGSELSAVEPADLGLVNPGGLRADLLYGSDGQITLAEANAVTPFANDLVVVTLTGEQLVQVLEQQWQPAGSSRPFLALGASAELSWSYDPAAPAGERIHGVRVSGEPLDPGASYRVATNSFLGSGGDNFTAFRSGTVEGTGLIDFDSFQAYLEEESPLSPEDYTGRVTVGPAVDPEPEPEPVPVPAVGVAPATAAAGSRVTVTVSGFAAAERVDVALAGRRLGSITTDAQGAGSVQVTVPIGTRAGTVDVVATASGADRTATAALQVTAPPPPATVGELVTRVVSWIGNAVRTLLGWFGR